MTKPANAFLMCDSAIREFVIRDSFVNSSFVIRVSFIVIWFEDSHAQRSHHANSPPARVFAG